MAKKKRDSNISPMLSYTELRPGLFIEWQKTLWQVLEADFVRMQQRKPVMKTKLKDVLSGKVREISFQPSDEIEEAELSKIQARFIYESRGQYWFDEANNPKNRFFFAAEQLGSRVNFLKASTPVTALVYGGNVISVELPIKMDFVVIEAPPSIKGDTASGGSKQVVLETGIKISVPFFINEGDIVRVNTQTGEYTERIEKA